LFLRIKQRRRTIIITALIDSSKDDLSLLASSTINSGRRSFSSEPPSSPSPDRPFRLHRPDRPQQQQQQQWGQGTNRKTNPGAPLYTPAYQGMHSNVLLMFPGDYGDSKYDMDANDGEDAEDPNRVEMDPEEIEYRERVREEHEKEQAQWE
jgi:hypothetical protein